MLRKMTLLLALSANLFGQQPAPTPPNPPSSNRVQQMRADLNQMESLMNNMQSEINFLRDQNLQILLNTNVRMWTILIRDLRAQLDEEERRGPLPAPVSPVK